jgi:CheY-like chemotaxis protein/TolA-binding protein
MIEPQLLLVDSDARSLSVLEVSLHNAGYAVTTAASGQDALDKIAFLAPDLVISDATLQGMDGFELCGRLKADPRFARIPFVFLTTRGAEADRSKGLGLGAADYLVKPMFVKEVVARVKLLLELRAKEETEQALHRLEGRVKLLEQLPPLAQVFELDYGSIGAKLPAIPDDVNLMLKLFDGRRTLSEVIAAAPFDELAGLEAARSLYVQGLLLEVLTPSPEGPPAAPDIERWAAASPPPAPPAAAPSEGTVGATAAEVAPAPATPAWPEASRPSGWGGVTTGEVPISPPAVAAAPELAAALAPPPEAAAAPPAATDPAPQAAPAQPEATPGAEIVRALTPSRPLKIVHFPSEPRSEAAAAKAAPDGVDAAFFGQPAAASGETSTVDETSDLTPALSGNSGRRKLWIGVGVVSALVVGIWMLSSSKPPPAPAPEPTPAPSPQPAAELPPVPEAAVPDASVAAAPPAPATPGSSGGAVAEAPPTPANPAPEPAAPTPAPAPVDTQAVYDQALAAGEAKYNHGSRKEAIAEYRKAIAAKPDGDVALAALGSALYESGKTGAAIKPLEHALQVNPNNSRACLTLGTIYQEQGDAKGAAAMYRRYLAADPHGKFADDVKSILKTLK